MIKRFFLPLLLVTTIVFQLSAQDRYRHIFSDEVYFEPSQYEIQPTFLTALDSLITLVKRENVAKIIIQANTDSLGGIESNEKLSFNRGKAIVDYLQKKGLEMNLIDIRAYGQFNPIADNRTAEGRAKNRRVSIHVMGPYDPNAFLQKAIVKGQVLDGQTNVPLPNSRVLMLYLGGFDTVYTDIDGRFEKEFATMTTVEVRVYAKNFFFNAKLAQLTNKASINLVFKLEPAIIGGKMFLSNLYFKSGTALLMASSEKALEGILTFMQYNENLKFEIGGHINRPNELAVTKESPSYVLSEARAKAVYDYLAENGIPTSRLGYKGYGNFEMIYPNAQTEIQEQMNRRVELKIVE